MKAKRVLKKRDSGGGYISVDRDEALAANWQTIQTIKRPGNKTKWDVLHSSKKEDWATPQALFEALARRYGPFDLDAAASAENRKCGMFFEAGDWRDGPLVDFFEQHDWAELGIKNVWLNPPYGRSIGRWLEKAYEESQNGCRVVCLVPSRTGSKWFKAAASRASEVLFIVGRITFEGAPSPAPFDSAVIVFDRGAPPHDAKGPTKIHWIAREELLK